MSLLLTEWHLMGLCQYIRTLRNAAKIQVFNYFVDTLLSIQNQLNTGYQQYLYVDVEIVLIACVELIPGVRDLLLTALDIPPLQDPIRERMPLTRHWSIRRVKIRLIHQPKTEGTLPDYAAEASDDYKRTNLSEHPHETESRYSLGQQYGGKIQSSMNTYGTRPTDHHGRTGRLLHIGWIRSPKRCFVRIVNHNTNGKHTHEEVTAGINRFEKKAPTARPSEE